MRDDGQMSLTHDLLEQSQVNRLKEKWSGCAGTPLTMPNGRHIGDDPRVGDRASRRDKPTREITKRFTDATGQECIWYSEEKFMTLKAWKRWLRESGAKVKL